MKNKLMILVLLASLNGALFAQQEQPEDVHARCKETLSGYRQEIATLRDNFAMEINRRRESLTMQDLFTLFPELAPIMPAVSLSATYFPQALFLSEINKENAQNVDPLIVAGELKRIMFLLFLITKDASSINVTLEPGEAQRLFKSFSLQTQNFLISNKLVTLKNPTFYDRNAFKIKIVALISLCVFLYKYRDTFFENSVVVKEKLERLMEKLISTFKSYAVPTFVFAGVAAKEAYNYVSNSNVLEPVKKYFSRN